MRIRILLFVMLTLLLSAAPAAAREKPDEPCASFAGPGYSICVVGSSASAAAKPAGLAQTMLASECASYAGPGYSICVVGSSTGSSSRPAGLALPAIETAPAKPVSGIEPGAGAWHTWVLASGSELRLPPPPDTQATRGELDELRALADQRDAAAKDQIAYWDAGAPSYRWIELTLDQLRAKPMPPHLASRLMSLLNVAMYDATVAAWDSKYAYDRRSPADFDPRLTTIIDTPDGPSYPSEHAAAAGAAAAILAYAYPDDAQHFNALVEEAGRSRLLAGVSYPSDVSAGLELGRAVAEKVIARAMTDGSDAQWTGTVPVGPGLWVGTNPAAPLLGTWKPWVLESGDQFRPGPPIAYDSAEKAAELEELHAIDRTIPLIYTAYFNHTFDGLMQFWWDEVSQRIFEYGLDENPPRAALIYATMSIAHYDSVIACFDAKYAYWAIRPAQLDPTLTTIFPAPNHPSYPAAHACATNAYAGVQAHFFPQKAAYISSKADESGYSRMVAGIHYRSDIEAGAELGRNVAEEVLEAAELP